MAELLSDYELARLILNSGCSVFCWYGRLHERAEVEGQGGVRQTMYLVHRVLTQVHNVRCMVGNLSHAAPPKGSVDVSFQVSSARTMYAYAHLHLLIDSCTPAIPVLAVFLNLVYIPLLLQPVLSVLTILDWS